MNSEELITNYFKGVTDLKEQINFAIMKCEMEGKEVPQRFTSMISIFDLTENVVMLAKDIEDNREGFHKAVLEQVANIRTIVMKLMEEDENGKTGS